MSQEKVTGYLPLCAALFSGAGAAIVASLVSLPLNSPHDGIFNTVLVSVACLGVALLIGLVQTFVSSETDARWRTSLILLWVMIGAMAAISLIVALVLEFTILRRSVSYIVPLTAIAITLMGLGTWYMPRHKAVRKLIGWVGTAVAVVGALALGIILTWLEVGFTQTTVLELRLQ